jgi:hypothetical protein
MEVWWGYHGDIMGVSDILERAKRGESQERTGGVGRNRICPRISTGSPFHRPGSARATGAAPVNQKKPRETQNRVSRRRSRNQSSGKAKRRA